MTALAGAKRETERELESMAKSEALQAFPCRARVSPKAARVPDSFVGAGPVGERMTPCEVPRLCDLYLLPPRAANGFWFQVSTATVCPWASHWRSLGLIFFNL